MKIWVDKDSPATETPAADEEEIVEDKSDRCILHAIVFEVLFAAVIYIKSYKAGISYLIALAPLVIFTAICGSYCYRKSADMKLFRAIACLCAMGIGVQYLIDAKYSPVSEFSIIKYILSFLLAIVFIVFYSMFQKILKHSLTAYCMMGLSFGIYILLYFFGYDPNGYGTNAWISIHGLTLQLTDFTKVSALLFYSSLLTSPLKNEDRKVVMLSTVFFFLNLIGSLSIHELGSFFILFFLHLSMLFIFLPHSKMKAIYLVTVFMICFLSVAGCFLLYKAFYTDYSNGTLNPVIQIIWPVVKKVYERFSITANIYNDPYGAGYQLLQGKKSLWMAGLFGNTVNFTALPVAESDMAFVAMICQLGWITGFVFLYFLCRITTLGLRYTRKNLVKHREDAIVVFGATIMLFLQAILVILGSCNVIPLTGLPIPFLSRGSTYLTIVFCFVALQLHASFEEQEEPVDEQYETYQK